MAIPAMANPVTANPGLPAALYLHAAQPWVVVPRGNPNDPLDHTSFHPNERLWSVNRLPLILGQLEPHDSWLHLPKGPIPNTIENGTPVLDGNGAPVKDFWFLPRHLASWKFLEPWRVEVYFRMDRRLTYRDLWARMLPGTDYKFHNTFNNSRSRNVRCPLNMISWEHRQVASRATIEVLERLTPQQLAHNTSWDVLPQGIAQPLNNARYPGDRSAGLLPFAYFIEGHRNIHFPSERLKESLNELFRLQDLAFDQGLKHWTDLNPSHQNPNWWTRIRTSGVGSLAMQVPQAIQAAPVESAGPTTLSVSGSAPLSAAPTHPLNSTAFPNQLRLEKQDEDTIPGPNIKDTPQTGPPSPEKFQSAYSRGDIRMLESLFLDLPDKFKVNINPIISTNTSDRGDWVEKSDELFEICWNEDTSVDVEFLRWVEESGVRESIVATSTPGVT